MRGKFDELRKNTGLFFKKLSAVTSNGEIFQSSIVIAYYVLFSFFPIFIVIGNVLPLFHIDTRPIVQYLEMVLPSDIIKYVVPIVNSLLKSQSTGYISFGAIVALWSVSCMVNAIRIGMNRLYGVHRQELKLGLGHFVLNRILTILFSALLFILFVVLFLTVMFGQQILTLLAPIFQFSMEPIDRLFSYRWLVLLIMMLMVTYYLNVIVPNVTIKGKANLPGSIVTVILWEALLYGFSFYLEHFPVRWENYGIIGTFIIFMLWLNLAATALLFGTAVNVTIDQMRFGQAVYSNGIIADYIKRKRNQTINKAKKRGTVK